MTVEGEHAEDDLEETTLCRVIGLLEIQNNRNMGADVGDLGG